MAGGSCAERFTKPGARPSRRPRCPAAVPDASASSRWRSPSATQSRRASGTRAGRELPGRASAGCLERLVEHEAGAVITGRHRDRALIPGVIGGVARFRVAAQRRTDSFWPFAHSDSPPTYARAADSTSSPPTRRTSSAATIATTVSTIGRKTRRAATADTELMTEDERRNVALVRSRIGVAPRQCHCTRRHSITTIERRKSLDRAQPSCQA